MAFTKFVNDTLANADEVVDNFNSLTKLIIQNGVNSSLVSDNFVYDQITSDTADVKLNFTYASGSYVKTTTALGSLEFNDLLSSRQKRVLTNVNKACVWVDFKDTGSVNSTVISNRSFETVVGSADYTGWGLTLNQATGGTMTAGSNKTYVTNGTISAGFIGSITNASTGYSGSLTQTIDVSDINYISVDFIGSVQQMSGTALDATYLFTLLCGGISSAGSVQSGTGYAQITNSGTLIIDVSSLTGNQTLTLVNNFGGGFSSRTYHLSGYFDNVRADTDGLDSGTTTRTIQLTANGTNWENVTNGSWHEFSNTGSLLGLKIVDTRTDSDNFNANRVLNYGIVVEK